MKKPSAVDFFSTIPASALKSIGSFSSISGIAVTSWSSVLYINTGTGIHAFMFDGTPLWSTLVQFNNSLMKSPQSVASCARNMTDCIFLSSPAVDQCDGSIYVARSDGWLYAFTSWQPFLRWRYDLNVEGALTSVAVTAGNNGRVYVATVEHSTVHVLSAKLGTLVWQANVGPLGPRSCSPVVDSSGWVSIGSLDGLLYVISPDGAHLNKYLADDVTSPVLIQTVPLLDCSGKAIYVAQLRVKFKTIQQIDGSEVVSFTQSWGTNLWMLLPSTGEVLWKTWYPGLFPAALLERDLSSYIIDSNWLIAISATANLSSKSLCQTEEKRYKKTCSEFLFTPTNTFYPGGNKKIIAFCISIMVIFLLLSVFSVLLYCNWKKRQAVLRQKLCKLLKQQRFRHPQGLLLKRRTAYVQTLKCLQTKFEDEPHSTKILEELQATLEGLNFIERYLASYPSDMLLTFCREKLPPDLSSLPESSTSSTEDERPSCCILAFLNFVFQRISGSFNSGNFSEEMGLLSAHCDWTASTGPETLTLDSVKLKSPNIWGTPLGGRSRAYSDADPLHISSDGFNNPLYGQSTVSSPVPRELVTFSSTEEGFKENDLSPPFPANHGNSTTQNG